MDNVPLMETLGMDGFELGFPNLEAGYLTEDQMRDEGFAVLAGANIFGLSSTRAVEDIFFHHPIFGIYNKGHNRHLALKSGCEFCTWFYNFVNQKVPIDVIPGQDLGFIAVEVDCGANSQVYGKGRRCAETMANLKTLMSNNAFKIGEKPIQYVNTPSCDKHGPPFYER